jgi:hypothetical protein
VEILGVMFVDAEGREKKAFAQGERFEARVAYRSNLEKEAGRPVFGIAIATAYKMLISGPNTLEADWERKDGAAEEQKDGKTEHGADGTAGEGLSVFPREGVAGFPREGVVRFIVPELPLSVGEYLFSAAAYNSTLSVAYDHHELQYSFRVSTGPQREFGLIKLKADWKIGPADKSGTHHSIPE